MLRAPKLHPQKASYLLASCVYRQCPDETGTAAAMAVTGLAFNQNKDTPVEGRAEDRAEHKHPCAKVMKLMVSKDYGESFEASTVDYIYQYDWVPPHPVGSENMLDDDYNNLKYLNNYNLDGIYATFMGSSKMTGTQHFGQWNAEVYMLGLSGLSGLLRAQVI